VAGYSHENFIVFRLYTSSLAKLRKCFLIDFSGQIYSRCFKTVRGAVVVMTRSACAVMFRNRKTAFSFKI
jgi:hypothetical protein